MPELPEVETVRRGLAPAMADAKINRLELKRANLRFPFPDQFVERMAGRQIRQLRRRAKYLLMDLDGDETIIAHLGMSGSFRIEAKASNATPGIFHHDRSKLEKHDHAIFHLDGGELGPVTVTYNDPRRFGFLLLHHTGDLHNHPLIRDIGIEPLDNELSGPAILSLFEGVTSSLKSALLDQKRIAGLGNIYVCEALWRTKLSPFRAAGSLQPAEAEALSTSIRAVLEDALVAGGSSLRDHRQADGSLGYFQHRFAAYDREAEACRHKNCKSSIRRDVQSGRSTFWCASCQV